MTGTNPAAAFAAFREAVLDDVHLQREVRRPQDREAYVARLMAIGVARGFVFDDAVVRAALREGELTWLASGADVA